MTAKIGACLGALLVIASITSGVIAIEARYARSEELSSVSSRLDQKILQDRLEGLQSRLWRLEDRHSDLFYGQNLRYPASFDELLAWVPQNVRDQFRSLLQEIKELELQLQGVE